MLHQQYGGERLPVSRNRIQEIRPKSDKCVARITTELDVSSEKPPFRGFADGTINMNRGTGHHEASDPLNLLL